MVKIIQDSSNSKYYRVGEFSALQLSAYVASQEIAVWGAAIVVSNPTATQVINDANNNGITFLTNLPTSGELGQALTSTVVLVNDHADENRDEIIDAINA